MPARYLVVAGLFALSLITYVDRAAIASIRAPLSRELALSDARMGAVFSAFALGYALAQVPSGWLADVVGPRRMLSLLVFAWSILTAVTGLAWSYSSLLAVRFLFGAAEAGAFPGAARAIYSWLPSGEHGRANGINFSASRLGAAFAFPLMAWLLARWSWRETFFWLALPGLLWGAAWWYWFRDQPRVASKTARAATTDAPPLKEILRRPAMWLAMSQYLFTNFVTFLCLSWMLPYLERRYRLTPADAAFHAMIPLVMGAAAQWVSGFLVDRLYTSSWQARSRQIPAMIGFGLAATGIGLLPFAEEPATATLGFAMAAFGADMTISPSWSFCIDHGGAKSGAVSGAMNMAGNLGSFLSANAFPFLMRPTGDASPYFWLVTAMSAAGALCWLGMKRSRSASPAPPLQ